MTGAREPRICRDWYFNHAKSFHRHQRWNEAMRAVEKFHVHNAFAFEDARGATGVIDVFTGELVPHR
jgi:hypothetical protein